MWSAFFAPFEDFHSFARSLKALSSPKVIIGFFFWIKIVFDLKSSGSLGSIDLIEGMRRLNPWVDRNKVRHDWATYQEIETVLKYKNEVYKYDRHMPLIFIGGMPRSGTTLMRAMLDAHPLVRCGEETRVVPRILQMVAQWRKSPKETLRLNEAGLTEDVLDAGVAAFILEVVARHGEPAARLCNKDPFTLKSADYLAKMFPKLKFIFMIRDGRATVHSMMTRHVTITGFDLQDFKQCLKKWNQAMTTMHEQCRLLGAEKCLPVFYEQLVLHPKPQLRRILEFLDLPWNENVLHHEKMIGKPGGISLSKVERSSDQVIKPVNLEALTSWIGHVPEDVSDNLEKLAPMMKVLGYDPNDPNPTYGNPDQIVREKTKDVIENQETWQKKAEQLLRINHEDVLNDVAVAA
ncbi:unnamed protein product [Notodromas monacha]|uniref:Protein-tyrosine sulfotransferase n=1 Tax=Notodromas monacha TaxID=399045 RepID=A0A7R9G9S1_9CRUS|nr:unnamed protein product [Notodromas monacha]CAG0914572.1 unnamed protein product [Notodromas monacha]